MDIGLTSILVGITTCLIAAIVLWIKKQHGYFKSKNITCPPVNFFFGNFTDVVFQKESFGTHMQRTYNYFKSLNLKHGGIYLLALPLYIPIDLDLIKNILQTDFSHFVDRGVYYNEKDDPLSANLFSIEGMEWKRLRAKFTPTFSSGKMKLMFPLVADCARNLIMKLEKHISAPIDIREILARYTTDVIGCCAFGIECNSLAVDDNKIRYYGKQVFEHSPLESLKMMIAYMEPNIMKKLGTYQNSPEASNFFRELLVHTIKERSNGKIKRNDFLDLLLQLQNKGHLDDEDVAEVNGKLDDSGLTVNEMAAQCFIFFIAGFETASTTLTFCLLELALNPEIQDKTRQEIIDIVNKYDGKLCYEATREMIYVDKVIRETLRKYPPLPVLHRICTKDYNVPGTDVVLEVGTKVWIPIMGVHHDEDFYPDPMKFDPERFSEEEKTKRPHVSYMPFGDGPRNCIGLRFGKMQTIVGLCAVLQNFRVRLNSKTQLPIDFDPKSVVLLAKGGVWLELEKL